MGRKSQARRASKGKLPKDRSWRDALSTGPKYPLVRRNAAEEFEGRLYPPTLRIRMDETGQVSELDALATMCGIAESRLTGDDARCLAALVVSAQEQMGSSLVSAELGIDDYIASYTRLFEQGFVGYDERGGYLTAKAKDMSALSTLAGAQ